MSPEILTTILVAVISATGGIVAGYIALRKLPVEKKALEVDIYGDVLEDLRSHIRDLQDRDDRRQARIERLEKKVSQYYQENLQLRLEVEQSREYIINLEGQLEAQIEQSNNQIKDLQARISVLEEERNSLLSENTELKRRLDRVKA